MGAFCEDSRVKFPTLMHLMGMGYKYISQRGLFTKYVTIPKTESDTLTNILLQPFSEAYLRLNPLSTQDDADAMLHRIPFLPGKLRAPHPVPARHSPTDRRPSPSKRYALPPGRSIREKAEFFPSVHGPRPGKPSAIAARSLPALWSAGPTEDWERILPARRTRRGGSW